MARVDVASHLQYGNAIFPRVEGSDIGIVRGTVSTTGTTTSAVITGLKDFGDDFFIGYKLKVVGSPTAITAMSVGTVTNYVSSTGTFTTTTMDGAFTADDDVIFGMPSVVGNGGVATVSTPDASVTAWTVDPHTLFTVTGAVRIKAIFGDVSKTVSEGAGADNTVSVGTPGSVALMIGVLAADGLVTGDVYAHTTATHTAGSAALDGNDFIVVDTTIDLNVLGTNSCDDGVIKFYVEWESLGGGMLVSTAWA